MSLGMGVMIRMLGANDSSVAAVQSAIGKRITSVALTDEALSLGLDDGRTLVLSDEGQSCCESRYMHSDDDLASFVGSVLRGVEVRDAPDIDDGGDCHEVQFLAVQTDGGELVCSAHNEHNGYYGGFSIEAKIVDAPPERTGPTWTAADVGGSTRVPS